MSADRILRRLVARLPLLSHPRRVLSDPRAYISTKIASRLTCRQSSRELAVPTPVSQDALSNAMHQPTASVAEVGVSLALGLRDGMRPRLALMSIMAGLVAFAVWLSVFIVWRSDLWTWSDITAKWAMNGLLSLMRPDGGGAGGDVATSVPTAVSVPEKALHWITTPMVTAVKVLLITASLVLLIMLSMRVYLEVFLMSRVQEQCLKHYSLPSLGVEASVSLNALSSLKMLIILAAGLLLLVIPVLGGILFFLLASYLNVRSLVNDALEDLATVEERRTIVQAMRLPMLLLGIAVAGLLLIPLAGLFVPAILGASVCHLCMRALVKMRSTVPNA